MDPLLVDLYPGDGRKLEDIRKLQAAGPPWHGVVLKATQGTMYRSDWFRDLWKPAHNHAAGQNWSAAAYHYYVAGVNPVAQAHVFLREIHKSGGFFSNTLPCWVDVERDGQPLKVSGTQIADGVARFAECIEEESGRPLFLYAGEYLRTLARDAGNWLQTSHWDLGCKGLIIAAYTEILPKEYYQDLGFRYGRGGGDHQLFGWQYCGDGSAKLQNYPHTTPLGPEDITAVTWDGGGDAALKYLGRPWPEINY